MKLLLFPLLLLTAAALHAQDSDARAQQLAREVWKASGGEHWPRVKQLQFTFIVEQDGKTLVEAKHDWDVAGQTDHVRWKDKDVKVNLAAPGTDEDSKAAFGRWINDSYWLLAPLKVLDPGVKLTYEGQKEIGGAPCEALRLSFAGVGLTPGDQYVLYIDPETKLPRAWDYIPKPESVTHGTWEEYIDAAGLKLSTKHDFAGRVIRFADVRVVTDR